MPVKLWCPDMGRKAGVILARGPNRDGSKGFQDRQGRGNVATFTATHKQWHGQVELFPDGTFTRVGKDGGTWKTVWDEQRDTDDGGQSGDLILTWDKWGDEKLRSSDGGHVFKHQEYTFELELMSAQVPMWITTEMDSLRRAPFHQLPRSPSDLDLAAAECTAELPLAAKKRHLKSELAALQQQAEAATQMLRELQAEEDAEEAAATPAKPLLPVLKLRLVPGAPPTAAKPSFSRGDVRVVKRFDPTRVPAASLYRSATGEETWEPCAVESYDAPTGKFWIEWGAKVGARGRAGRKKLVDADSLRFACPAPRWVLDALMTKDTKNTKNAKGNKAGAAQKGPKKMDQKARDNTTVQMLKDTVAKLKKDSVSAKKPKSEQQQQPKRNAGTSIWRTAGGEESWEPCFVDSYDTSSSQFWIEWGASVGARGRAGRKKLVTADCLRFDRGCGASSTHRLRKSPNRETRDASDSAAPSCPARPVPAEASAIRQQSVSPPMTPPVTPPLDPERTTASAWVEAMGLRVPIEFPVMMKAFGTSGKPSVVVSAVPAASGDLPRTPPKASEHRNLC
jgi:hypothetical protein